MATPRLAHAESGVSPNRLKLPSAPGSIRGVGEDVEANVNMGMMTYGVPIRVPEGFEGMTPELRLGYSSGAGASTVGMGWSLQVPSIERMTDRGLPSYDLEDRFAVNSSRQIVRISEGPTTEAVYRARYEGSFIRYTFHTGTPTSSEDHGSAGWWKAEYPDGRVGYFGADSQGRQVADARVKGPDGVFRYHLVEMTDTIGHRLRYRYTKDGSTSLLKHVGWVFKDGQPRYEIKLNYEDRPDVLSNAKPGFDVRLTRRVSEILVHSNDERLRRYKLNYESMSNSGGLTRLADVHHFGRTDADRYPVFFSFDYSGGVPHDGCSGDGCVDPQLHEVGSVGVDLGSGKANLIDLNGDALPDVVDTSGAAHQIHINRPTDAAGPSFTPPTTSNVANGGAADLASPAVQMVDLDGDGFTDLIDGANRRVLWNRGAGDWEKVEAMASPNLPDFQSDANLRFFDWNNDAKIDVIHSDSSTTWYYINRGGGLFEAKPTPGQSIGAGFSQDGLQLADLNGDGMQDAVRMARGLVSYRLYLGRGDWSGWIDMKGVPDSAPLDSRFADINGDGLSDLVAVVGDRIKYALNRNGRHFGTLRTISSARGEGLPIKTTGTSIRFADMNGNGSTDIVWADASGSMTYLEMFPTRPNLLERIENGLGMIMELDYGSTVGHMAASKAEWEHRLPHPMLTVDQISTWDTLTGRRHTRTFHYRDGYWDSEMRKFRGFANVDVKTQANQGVEAGSTTYRFDVGVLDRYHKGKLLEKIDRTDGDVIREVRRNWTDCDVAEVPETVDPEVRFICPSAKTLLVKEGRSKEEWVEVREEYSFDGYGNKTQVKKLGVIKSGGGGCKPCDRPASVMGAPCGNTCRGDEAYMEADYISPGENTTDGRWILRKPHSKRHYSRPDGPSTEERSFYDGEPFKGLESGRLTRGLTTRVAKKTEDGQWIDSARRKYDRRGNVVEMRDAEGNRRRFEYDDWNLLPVAEEAVLDDRQQQYRLRMEMDYHPVFARPVESTAWMRAEDGQTRSARRPTRYAYDTFGRLEAIAKPGDSLAKPTSVFQFDLAEPASRIVRRTRSKAGGPLDAEEILCFDGRGRKYQTRTKIDDGRYQIDGFSIPTRHEKGKYRKYEPYVSKSGRCDLTPPEDVPYIEKQFDTSGRPLQTLFPDGDIYGKQSRTKKVYRPLTAENWDRADTDPDSPHFETPETIISDGLNRKVAFERYDAPDGEPLVTRVTYDELGNLRGYVDPEGHEKIQHYDRLGRVVRVQDPDSGVTTFEYDAAGNRTARTDARGETTRYDYDELGRRVAKWKAGARPSTEIHYYYDQLEKCPSDNCTNLAGRPAALSYPLGDAGAGADGQSSADTRGWERMGYDARGRQIYFARTLDGVQFGFDTVYDNAGRTVAMEVPGGRRVDFELDGASRITSVPGHLPEISYSDRDTIQRIGYANGTHSRRERDAMLRLESLTTVGPQGTALQQLEYRRDRTGNIVELEDHSDLPDGVPSADATYSYDALYRLTDAQLQRPSTDQNELLSYTYDRIDNLVEKTSNLGESSPAHVGSMSYGADAGPHAVTDAGGISFQYDEAGRLVARGSTGFRWDYMGRMTAAERGERTLVRFAYGADNRRLKKVADGHTTYYLTPDFEVRDGTSVLYVRLDKRRLVELRTRELATILYPDMHTEDGADADGRITVADAWLHRADEAGWLEAEAADVSSQGKEDDQTTGSTGRDRSVEAILAASARRMLDDIEDGPRRRFLHHDHLGNVSLTTDDDGEVLDRSAYYPFGAQRPGSASRDGQPGFTGKERDPATGLHYFGARHFHSRVGRWMSPDPHFEVLSEEKFGGTLQELDRYGYTENNPVNAYDPDGEFVVLTSIAIGVAVGAAISGGAEAASQLYKNGEVNDFGAVMKEAAIGGVLGVFSGGSAAVGRSAARVTAREVLKQTFRKEAMMDFAKEAVSNAALSVGPSAWSDVARQLGASEQTAELVGDAAGALNAIASVSGSGIKMKKLRRFMNSNSSNVQAIARLRQGGEGGNIIRQVAGATGLSSDDAADLLVQMKGMVGFGREAASQEEQEE